MAAISPVTTYPEQGVMKVVWSSVTSADTFTAAQVGGRYADRTVTVTGTFDSATILIKGSLDGSNYLTLTGNASSLSLSATGTQSIIELTQYIQPTHSGGGGSEAVTVTLYCSKR